MSTINNGGPAFPIADVPYPNGNVQHGWNGMSLRDWFAGQALAGLLAHTGESERNRAVAAYRYADAMLRARDTREVKP
jgi:hypothetical protein